MSLIASGFWHDAEGYSHSLCMVQLVHGITSAALLQRRVPQTDGPGSRNISRPSMWL